MKKIYFLLLFFIFTYQNVNAQQLSVYSEISILTIGPGDQFFEKFGHSAIRIKDPVLQLDYIFNYGIFNFNQPNFYSKFAKGELLYKVAANPYSYFIQSYKMEKRWVKEQILNLTQPEKQAFYVFLRNNILPQNASYRYDPFIDNCATKLRDITKNVLGDKLKLHSGNKNTTLRKLMNDQLLWNSWGSFGLNIGSGTNLDSTADISQQMYLPDYVYSAFKDAQKIENGVATPLVKKENILLDFEEKKSITQWYNPVFIFSILFLISLVVTYRDQKKQKQSKWLDFIILFVTGIIGIVVLFMWFISSHSSGPNNFNLLWAFAPNLFVAFLILKRNAPKWLSFYLKICLGLLLVTSILWIVKIQVFSLAILPILGILFVRYYYLNSLLSSKK